MEDVVKFIRIPKPKNMKDALPLYRDVYGSYKEIYNNAMAKGKGKLDPVGLAGNPIQLGTSNMNSLFKISPDGDISYSDYFVSTKADGLRFMMLIGNKDVEGNRKIYFVKPRGFREVPDFWIIEGSGDDDDKVLKIPPYLNVDKCLIDGELLFWGNIERLKNKEGGVDAYILRKNGKHKPFIGFLAFDVLYGPTNPDYVTEDWSKIPRGEAPKGGWKSSNVHAGTKFQLGSSGAMVGPKSSWLDQSQLVRWPTTRRRAVLEQMFLNQDSPFWALLHEPHPSNFIKAPLDDNGQIVYDPSVYTPINFTIFVSPFEKMSDLFESYERRSYPVMIEHLQKSITDQFYAGIRGSRGINRTQLFLPPTPREKNQDKGNGYLTDGLILTPAYGSYIIGAWTFCSNKQYKWKPEEDLTIDFKIGDKIPGSKYNIGLVGYSGDILPFVYEINDIKYTAAIYNTDMKKGTMVECKIRQTPAGLPATSQSDSGSYILFDIVMDRPHKPYPNAYHVAVGTLDGANVKNEVEFEYSTDIIFKVGDEIEGGYSANIKKLKGHGFFKRSFNVVISSEVDLTIGRTIQAAFSKVEGPNAVFRKVKYIAKTNKLDNQTIAQKKFDEIIKTIEIASQVSSTGKHKKVLPNVMDLIFIIKERFKYMSKNEQENVLIAFGRERLLKCFCAKHPLSLFTDRQRMSMLSAIQKKQANFDALELELQLKFRNNHNYSSCLIRSLVGSDYTPVPIIKSYGSKDLRTVYVALGDELIEEESMVKKSLQKIEVNNEIFNYDFDLVLSSETKVNNKVKKASAYEYQNRYTINNLSKFWRLDIIEYGNAKNWQQAKSKWENGKWGSGTRVELEYAPASYFKDVSNWNNMQAIVDVLGVEIDKNMTPELLRTKVQAYIQELNKTDPLIILKELASVLIKVFSILDMDSGNMKKDKATEKKSSTTEKAKSLWLRMRKFHNQVKRDLINEAADVLGDDLSLLDISVGRGGDLDKWNSSGIDKVRGIDPDQKSITEAIKRTTEQKESGRIDEGRDYEFKQLTISDPGIDNQLPEGKFDIVSCQFTLHYFFENPEKLERVVRRVSEALEPGGLFIGTAIIGDRVKTMNTKEAVIEDIDGHAYNFKLNDVEESGNYFNLQDAVEWYVDFDQFKAICERYGLSLKDRQPFEDLYPNWKGKKHWKLKGYEKQISFMYDRFIFQKEE